MDLDGQSLDTQRAYLQRGYQIWKRAALAHNLSFENLNPTDFVSWFEELLPNLQPASRRQYIAAIKYWMYYLMKVNPPIIQHHNNLMPSLEYCSRIQSNQYSTVHSTKLKKRTSSQKLKKVKLEDLVYLYRKNTDGKGKWIKPALLWMIANLLVGLRPIEWRTARLEGNANLIELVVMNAKNTHNRANGKERRLNITSLKTKEIQLIKAQLRLINQFSKSDEDWNMFYNGVRHTIKRIMRATYPNQKKYATLYSTRHQFSANAKSQGYSKVEVAALLGHASSETATFHYGKKKHGSGMCFVKASENNVKSVRCNPLPLTGAVKKRFLLLS